MERWTQRKVGYISQVPPMNNNMVYKANNRSELGDISITKMSSGDAEGNEAIIKSFGNYSRIFYETKAKKLKNPVLVYLGPENDFSNYTFSDIVVGCKKYWQTTPMYNLDFTGKLLLVLANPKRVLTADELTKITTFLSHEKSRIVVFSGSDESIANAILVQLGSKLEVIETTPAQTGIKNLSGYLPTDPKQLFWVPCEIVGFIGVNSAYWSTATIKDFEGYGLAYNNITNVMPTHLRFGSFPTWWSDVHGNHLYGSGVLNADTEWSSITWGTLLIPYPAAYITFTYTANKATLLSWITSNLANLPTYYLCPTGFVDTYTIFNYGQYANYEDISNVGTVTGSYIAYADGEKIIVSGVKPSWLSKSLLGHLPDLSTEYRIMSLSLWLIYGSLTLTPDMFNTGSKFMLPPPYAYTIISSYGTGDIIEFP
jgi:hypothetical protein